MTNRTSLLRRVPVLAALSLVALSACGDEQPAASNDTPAPVATDGAAASGADELRTPEPIEFVSGGQGDAAPEMAPVSADSRVAGDVASTDMMIAPTYVSEFVPGDVLAELPGNTTGYVYDASTDVTAEQIAALAAVFGVDGEAVRVEGWEPGGWQMGPTDGSAPTLFVSEDGQQMWSYSPAMQDQPAMAGCATPASPDGSPPPSTIECPTPEPPAGVPTAADAEARAGDLLAELGVDPSGMQFETYADEWSASVNVTEYVDGRLDGIPTGRYWGFGFGAEGALQWANGSLGAPQPVGPYTLVDLDTALDRLREQYTGSGAPMPVDLPVDPAIDPADDSALGDAATSDMVDPPVTEPAPDVEVAPAPTDSFPTEPVRTATYPAPEPVTVTLVDVQPDLWWAWAADGSTWMLPAYRFIGDDGGWYTVPAVTDDYLIEVAPPERAEPAETIIPATAPAPEPGTVAPVDTFPTDPSDTAALEPFVQTSLQEFTGNAEALGWTVRVVEIDGESQAITMDFIPSRVNVAVVTGSDGTQTVTAIVNAG